MAKTNSDSFSEEDLIVNDTAIDIEPSREDIGCVSTSTKPSLVKRLFNSDGRRFRKFVHSTTTHGVIHIFSGKSKLRRFFWLLLVLASASGCLYDIIESIRRLAQGNTDTTISVVEPEMVDFPAITLCNLNLIRKSYLQDVSQQLENDLGNVYDTSQGCSNGDISSSLNESFSDLLWNGRHTAEDIIFQCKYEGQKCDHNDFTSTISSGGVCYTFNSERGPSIRKTNGTGTRFALSLIINVQQYEYITAFNQDLDAGIKVAVHPRSELAQPDELGIAVPPGKNAFISVRRLNTTDKSSRRKCREVQDTNAFKFLQNLNRYSESACEIDCLMTNIAQTCDCLGPGTPSSESNFHDLQNCTVRDICCLIHNVTTTTCDCRVACETTLYITETSYSAFPATYAVNSLFAQVEERYGNLTGITNISSSENFLRENLLGINIYFETLTVEEQNTHDSYDAITMLSDIGGILALFLGASVISVLEFLAWIFDEVKDRCLGINERKIVSKVKPIVMVHKMKRHKVELVAQDDCEYNGDSGISIELQGIEYTKL